jgi:TetR/AcrR family transcriptional repressor of nem operon
MPRPPSDARIRLTQTALKLFASRGYYNTSIEDVLRESGCTRGILYYYFSSKEELGYAAIDVWMEAFAEQGVGSHPATNEHPIDRLIRALDELPSVVKIGTTDVVPSAMAARMAAVHEGFRQRLERVAESLIEQLEEIVRRGVTDGQIRHGVDPDQLAHMFVTMAMGIQYTTQLMSREAIWEDARRWMKEYLNSLRK